MTVVRFPVPLFVIIILVIFVPLLLPSLAILLVAVVVVIVNLTVLSGAVVVIVVVGGILLISLVPGSRRATGGLVPTRRRLPLACIVSSPSIFHVSTGRFPGFHKTSVPARVRHESGLCHIGISWWWDFTTPGPDRRLLNISVTIFRYPDILFWSAPFIS